MTAYFSRENNVLQQFSSAYFKNGHQKKFIVHVWQNTDTFISGKTPINNRYIQIGIKIYRTKWKTKLNL